MLDAVLHSKPHYWYKPQLNHLYLVQSVQPAALQDMYCAQTKGEANLRGNRSA